jgi:hypothetical protein
MRICGQFKLHGKLRREPRRVSRVARRDKTAFIARGFPLCVDIGLNRNETEIRLSIMDYRLSRAEFPARPIAG